MKDKFNLAIVGATGLVGRTMLKVLEERNFPINKLGLFASNKSKGLELDFRDIPYIVESIEEANFEDYDFALFSAGKEISIKYAPKAAQEGCIVVDNGSFWRMHNDVPLVVPEVNPQDLENHHGLIANPNCSTIQLVVVLSEIMKKFPLKRVVVSTYQSISGAGQKGINKLLNEIKGDFNPNDKHPIAYNIMFHELSDRNGFTVEEKKMYDETRKIMHFEDLKIAITCVRLPIFGGHCESVNIETDRDFTLEEIADCLRAQPSIKIIDNMAEEEYPTPQIARDTDFVYVGRIHRDYSVPYGFYLWIVADNLRKGAATNAIQILEEIIKRNLFEFKKIDFS